MSGSIHELHIGIAFFLRPIASFKWAFTVRETHFEFREIQLKRRRNVLTEKSSNYYIASSTVECYRYFGPCKSSLKSFLELLLLYLQSIREVRERA